MAGLMDMRELGMLRNATQRMDRGGGVDVKKFAAEEYQRKMEAEEEARKKSMIERAMAEDPRLQGLLENAMPGGAAGSLLKTGGTILKNTPFLRSLFYGGKAAKSAAQTAKKAVWTPGTKPHIPASGPTVPGTSGSVRSWVAPTAITAAEAGGVGLLYKDEISEFLGGTPEEEESGTRTVLSEAEKKFDEEEVGLPKKTSQFSPGTVEDLIARQAVGADRHPSMSQVMPQGEKEKEKLVIDPVNTSTETPANTPSLWKTWGSLADNPKERKKAYLSSIKNIYMKKMMLDSIAKLTGGTSQGGSWAQMAIAELDAVEKFDSEERVHQQWKALFFREDGTYDPPKNRKEAMERGGKLGYTADQMKDILTTFSKEEDNRTNIEKYEEYISSLPEGSPKRIALEKKYLGMHEEEKDDRTSFEKFVERGVNSGLITREEGDQSLKDKLVGTDSGLTAAQDNFNWYQSIIARGDEEEISVANKFLNINGQKVATLGEFLRLYTSQTFQDSDTFSASEKLQLENLIKRAMGLGVSTGTTNSTSGITITKKS